MKCNWIPRWVIGCWLAGCACLTACSPYEPPTENKQMAKELLLSVDGEITTDRMEVDFDIVSGNGGYKIDQADSTEARIGIKDEHVHVVLLKKETYFTITDALKKGVLIHIISTSPALIPAEYSLSFEQKGMSTIRPSFGNGVYTVKPRDEYVARAATAETRGNEIDVYARHSGFSEFIISDSDGRTAPLSVEVALGGIMKINLAPGERKEVEVEPDKMIHILLDGGGQWHIKNYDFKVFSYLRLQIDRNRVCCVTTTLQGETDLSSSFSFVDPYGEEAAIKIILPGTESDNPKGKS